MRKRELLPPQDEIPARGNFARTRLAVIDLDGTLLDSCHRVSDASRAAITCAREAGIRVILASSRAPGAMRQIIIDLDLMEPELFIASQGAVVGSYSKNGRLQTIRRQQIPLPDAQGIARSATTLGLTVHWFTPDRWYVSSIDDEVLKESEVVGMAPSVTDPATLNDTPDKLMFIAPPKEMGRLAALATVLPPTVTAQVSNPTYLEVTRAGVDKASAAQDLCRSWKITADEVVAFGDGPNDLALFAYAGISIAPANARPEVLDAASWITQSNDNDGVAEALQHIIRVKHGRS